MLASPIFFTEQYKMYIHYHVEHVTTNEQNTTNYLIHAWRQNGYTIRTKMTFYKREYVFSLFLFNVMCMSCCTFVQVCKVKNSRVH